MILELVLSFKKSPLLGPSTEIREKVGTMFEARPGQVHAIHNRCILSFTQFIARGLVSFGSKVDVCLKQ